MSIIKLINGPYDGKEIEDSGAVVFNMGLTSTANGAVGTAYYEPNQERTLAFWDRNEWLGIHTRSP